ncbi:MAG: tandem-95 repeat protein, partial [bacterium]
ELAVPSPGVLSNDSDDKGGPIKALLKSGPSHGSVILNANGSFIYRPNVNFNGLDSFTYTAHDGISAGNVAQATIRVNPVNDMPVAANDNYLIEGNSVLSWPIPGVLGNDLDVEGDTLSAILVNRPVKGNLILNAKGSFSYTPNPNFTGIDSFTYKAKDGRLESAAAKVLITMLPAGRELWPAHLDGPTSGAERAVAMAVDDLGNIYVTGWSFYLGRGFDFLTVKYSPNGNPLWIQRFNGPGNRKDAATAIALDQAGNVYVAGTSSNKDSTLDYAVLKYDTHGNVLWVEHYNGPGRGNDEVTALTLDSEGNVYLTGGSWSAQTGMDYMTVKYNTNGNFQWEQLYTGPGNNEDRATALAVDSRGNVYVTGESRGANTGFDYATLKYDPNGQLLWQRRHNGTVNGDDRPTALALDNAGNVYVTGGSLGQGTGMDYVTLKYNTNGNFVWIQRFNGSGNDHDRAVALAIDRENNVYLTGESKSADTGFDYVTLKYLSADGTPRWFRRYDGPTHGDDKAAALVLDSTGKVYVTGTSGGDYGTLKYDSQGNLLGKQLYNGPFNGVDAATAIGVDNAGNIYVTGGSEGLGTGEDFATVKFNPLASAVEEPSATATAPETYVLQQNHPNPFNPSTTIRFSLLRSGHVRLRVFGLAGNEVAVLADGQRDQGQHQVTWEAGALSTGVYFYRLEINGFTATRKLLLVK